MREIKFRTWYKENDVENKKMEFSILKQVCDHSSDDFEDFIYMQYAGLKDKNGVEIYEGDIIRRIATNPYWDKELIETDVVLFRNGCFQTNKFSLTITNLNEDYTNTYEVIGNIYENPELLKERK